MKAKLTILLAVGVVTIIFSSCKRYYDCECVGYDGRISKHVVNAPNAIEANKACQGLSTRGACELQ